MKLIELTLPETISAGETVTVKIGHTLNRDHGEQLVHVTLKEGPQGKRVERKVIKVAGKGSVEVTFEIPTEIDGNVVSFAAFVGEDYTSNLQHLQTSPIIVK